MNLRPPPRPLARTSLAALLGFALVSACAPPLDELTAREQPLINGTPSQEGFLPAVGALVINMPFNYRVFCTATLIAEDMVLAAAHCFSEIPTGYPIGFFTGRNVNASDPAAKIASIANIGIHYQYKGGTPPGWLAQYNDIALAKLSTPITDIAPMKIVRPHEVSAVLKAGTPVMVAGFGQTDPAVGDSAGAMHHGVTYIGQTGPYEIYLSTSNTPQKCHGDSGGPTIGDVDSGPDNDWRLIGVASRAGEHCTAGSIETRVDPYLDWIHAGGTIPCGSGLSPDCAPPAKKEIGESCAKSDECDGGLCVPLSDGSACSQYCSVQDQDCPEGYVCVGIQGSTQGACVPEPPAPKGKLGEPCVSASDCESELCGSAENESFCTEICTPETGCGDGFQCLPAGGDTYACTPDHLAGLDNGDGCAFFGSGRGASPPALPLLLAGLLLLLACRRR